MTWIGTPSRNELGMCNLLLTFDRWSGVANWTSANRRCIRSGRGQGLG
jgi:hypothetical protein